MSWGNCSVKVSSLHGDFHDEPKGVAPARPAGRGRRRPDHQSGGRQGVARDAPAVSAPQAAVSGGGRPGGAPPGAGAPPPPAGCPPPPPPPGAPRRPPRP